MKKVLPFMGLVALVCGLVAFILMLATSAIHGSTSLGDYSYSGVTAIFGHKSTGLLDPEYKPSILALIGWILALVGLLASLAGVLGGLLKIKALQKLGGLLMLVAAGCFLVAGIFMFLVVPTFFGANELDVPSSAGVGAGWVIGAILNLVAAAAAALPAVMGLLGKK